MKGTEAFDILHLSDSEASDLMEKLQIGLTVSEARDLQQRILKRAPTLAELILFGIQGSEHSSYKSSRPYLKLFETEGEDVIIGAKEDAGIIRICYDNEGTGYAIVMSHESHNHPSQIVPFEGAATGVGGNVRDVCCMGAKVVAVANDIRFGPIQEAHNRYLLREVVAGLASYANVCGLPVIAGGLQFDNSYRGNTLVTAVTLGSLKEDDIIHSYAPQDAAGYDLILVGKPTDNSGFGGASFSSFSISEDKTELNKGAVQEPNALLGRHLEHATTQLVKILSEKNLINKVACKDLGAGGIACATVEIADGGNYGCFVNLDLVPVSDPAIEKYIILCSETQERYLWATPKEVTPLILKHFNEDFSLGEVAYNAQATVIGHITKATKYVVVANNETLVDAEASEVTRGFLYQRPLAEEKVKTFAEPVRPVMVDLASMWLKILAHENIASRQIIYDRFDKQAQNLVTFEIGTSDAGVFRPFDTSDFPAEIRQTGVTLACNQNPRYNQIDVYKGAQLAVLTSFTNTVATGAMPVALSDCLCYGNPENPESMRDFAQGCAAVAESAKALKVPIIAGNVSLYNESNGASIAASPMIAMLGQLNNVEHAISFSLKKEDSTLLLVGLREEECGGSIYYALLGYDGNILPSPDVQKIIKAGQTINKLAQEKMILACHDISEGGLAVTLSEMAFKNEIGFTLLPSPHIEDDFYLFSETLGFVLEVENSHKEAIIAEFKLHGVDCTEIGKTVSKPQFSYKENVIALKEAKEVYANGLKIKLM